MDGKRHKARTTFGRMRSQAQTSTWLDQPGAAAKDWLNDGAHGWALPASMAVYGPVA